MLNPVCTFSPDQFHFDCELLILRHGQFNNNRCRCCHAKVNSVLVVSVTSSIDSFYSFCHHLSRFVRWPVYRCVACCIPYVLSVTPLNSAGRSIILFRFVTLQVYSCHIVYVSWLPLPPTPLSAMPLWSPSPLFFFPPFISKINLDFHLFFTLFLAILDRYTHTHTQYTILAST